MELVDNVEYSFREGFEGRCPKCECELRWDIDFVTSGFKAECDCAKLVHFLTPSRYVYSTENE